MKVSIISPVFKVEPYIGDCIQSLKAQTYTDFEVLFVDDHGPDNSVAVAKEAVADDPRFRFLSTPSNVGPGAARNVGIDAARGEFVAFIDSDDVWEPDFLDQLVNKAYSDKNSTTPFDLTYCQLKYHGGSRDGQIHRNPVLEAGAFTTEKKQYFLRHFVTFSVCFLFRRDFLMANDLRFPLLQNSEDTHFLTRNLLLARTIGCVDKPLYIYMVRESSLSTGRNRNKYKQRLAAIGSLRETYRQLCLDPKYSDLQLGQYRWTMRWLFFKKGYVQALRDLLSK